MIAEAVAAHRHPASDADLEAEIFGTDDPEAIAAALEAAVGPVERVLFYSTSAAVVAGLALADGRRVAIKVHRPHVDRAHLDAVHRIQRAVAARGFPCPRPLAPPRPLARGTATLEELLDAGGWRDTHEPDARRAVARALARLHELTADVDATGLREGALADPVGLWPQPHNPRFDLASPRGAWIDEIGAEARRRLRERAGEVVVGHNDWSGKHFRFLGERITAVYDWDSLDRSDEPRLVGQAAATFTATWELPVRLVPSLDEARAFVAEYEQARGRTFPPDERRRLAAAATYVLAYNARCEASVVDEPGPGSFGEALARDDFLEL